MKVYLNLSPNIQQKTISDHHQCWKTSMMQLRKWKTTKKLGADGIPTEALKEDREGLTSQWHALILKVWSTEQILSDLRYLRIITVLKKAKEQTARTIEALVCFLPLEKLVSGSLLTSYCLLLSRFSLRNSLVFRPFCGTTDKILVAHQMQKCHWQHHPYLLMDIFHSVYIHL